MSNTTAIKLTGFFTPEKEKKHEELENDIKKYFEKSFNKHVALNLDLDFQDYDFFGLDVIKIQDNCDSELIESNWELPCDGSEWAVTNSYEELETACKEYIRQSIWAFTPEYLASHISALDADDVKRLRGDKCEDINEVLYKLLDDFDDFAMKAIGVDGIGHFMSSYDGNLYEWNWGLYALRLN